MKLRDRKSFLGDAKIVNIKWLFGHKWIFFVIPIILAFLGFGLWWLINWLKERKEMHPPEYKRIPFFLYAKEGKLGLETFVSEDIDLLPMPYKKQLDAFLSNVLHNLIKDQKINIKNALKVNIEKKVLGRPRKNG